ncbi:sulfurtransferase [Malaciobacter mytili]|nr:sulfurtransferase [Malaciobacter mytili]
MSLFANEIYGSKGYTKSMKEHLISAKDAVKLLNKKNVVFVSGDSHDTYESIGHIKGSVEMYAHHLHHSDITGQMHCAPLFMCKEEAQKYIGSKGISNDTLVIAYDNFRGPNATGVWAFFKSFGHDKVKILNGGMDAVKAIDPNQKLYDEAKERRKNLKKLIKEAKDKTLIEKYKKEDSLLKAKMKEITPKLLIQKGKEKVEKTATYTINMNKINWDLIASKEDLLKASNDIVKNGKESSKYAIIDTRGLTEIIGERKMDNVARGGHIPGATFLEWNNITDFENKLSFRDLKELQKTFDKYGIKKDQTIYAYCHVGAGRSTEVIVALRMLGYKNAKVYTGSWDEWGNDMNLPINR